jgi:hypothetical protein
MMVGFITAITFFVLGISALLISRNVFPYDVRVTEDDKWIILIMNPDGSITSHDSIGTVINKTAVPAIKKASPVIKKNKPVKKQCLNVFPSSELSMWTYNATNPGFINRNIEPVKEPEIASVAEKEHLWVENSNCKSSVQRTICSITTANIVD